MKGGGTKKNRTRSPDWDYTRVFLAKMCVQLLVSRVKVINLRSKAKNSPELASDFDKSPSKYPGG